MKTLLALSAALVCVLPHSAMAQHLATAGDLTVGYSYLSAPADGVGRPAGWLVAPSRRAAATRPGA